MFEHLAVAGHAQICRNVIAFRLTDERVQEQTVDDLEGDLLQILVGAMHRVPRLKPHHGSPAEIRHPRTHLEWGQVMLREPRRRLGQRDHRAGDRMTSLAVKPTHTRMCRVVGAVHPPCLARWVGFEELGDVHDGHGFALVTQRDARGAVDGRAHPPGLGLVDTQDHRDGERMATGEAPRVEHRGVVARVHEPVQRRQRTGAEHVRVGPRAGGDLELRQVGCLSAQRLELVAPRQPLAHPE